MKKHNTTKPAKTDFKSIKKLFIYCKEYFPTIIVSIIFATIGAITTIVGPDKISDLMNVITDGVKNVSGIRSRLL